MIKDTLRLFLHSVDRDIETLEAMKAPGTILAKLRGMQDAVRSKWATIYSNDKKELGNAVEDYMDLNIDVNEVYNSIVNERCDYLNDNKMEEVEDIDEYILNELFLSYTIFLDFYHFCGFYYVICGNFPFHNSIFFAEQKALRESNKND
jgi:hypothetical protein